MAGLLEVPGMGNPHRMTSKHFRRLPYLRVATLAIAPSLFACALVAQPAKQAEAPAAAAQPDRAAAYYHYTLAHNYEDMATTYGRPEYATRAIEEYKLALNADPTSSYLNNHLAELYFKTGRVRDAIAAAEAQIKKDPNSLEAHKLLGRIYLRSLGDLQNNNNGPSQQMLQLALGEYNKIVSLEPNNVEDRLMLGQLYSFNHDSVHAEEQFKAAQKIDPSSEEVVLFMARLYTEQGDLQDAIKVLSAVPQDDQTPRIEYALGASYDQVKDTKKAIAAYKRALDLEPDNLEVERALAQALLNDGQEAAALKAFKDIVEGDPTDAQSFLRIAEIERHKGNYSDAYTAIKKAQDLASDSLDISFNEALIEDSLGHYSDAAQLLEKLAAGSEHTSGQYSEAEKNNRSIFLDRLANVYREQNQTDKAIATYQKMAVLGGDYATRAYQGEVDTYRDAHEYDKATQAARDAVQKMPQDRGLKLMLAGQLADTGHADEGISLAKALLKGTPQDREVELSLAQIYTRLRKWKDASEQLDKADALSTKPEDKLYTDFLRGALEERQKHYDQAEVWFNKVLAIDPNNSMTLNYLGYMLADRGVRLNDALAMIQKAVKLDPQNYAFLDSLGWAYFKLGNYTQSEQSLIQASERNSTDPTVHDHLGELYEKTGRLKQAAAQWEESLNQYQRTIPADAEPGEMSKVQKKLDNARVRLAKESSMPPAAKP